MNNWEPDTVGHIPTEPIHFVNSTLNKGHCVVAYNVICGETFRVLGTNCVHDISTIDPRKVTCQECLNKMVNYKENMTLSLLVQDFGTITCAKRFRS